MLDFVQKIADCDVVFADEYNTSQVCGRCQWRLGTTPVEIATHKRWTSQGHRHRQCNSCVPNEDVISFPEIINTKLGSKAIAIRRLERIRALFFSRNNVSLRFHRRNRPANLHQWWRLLCRNIRQTTLRWERIQIHFIEVRLESRLISGPKYSHQRCLFD